MSCDRWPADLPPGESAPAASTPLVEGDHPWQASWRRLAAHEQAVLASVPAGMALHAAVADADVVGVAAALRGPLVARLPEPLVVQAAEFLDRLAVLVAVGS